MSQQSKGEATMNCVYIRISTVGQNEAGQRAEIDKWLAGNGIADATYYVDKDTGDNLDRPEFIRLQSDIFAGQVKTVIVWKLDRLSRRLRDGIDKLCDWLGKGVRLVSVTQQLDFAGPAGKMIASVLFAVAEMEQQTRRERQAAGIAVAKRNGVYQGRKAGSLKADAARALALRSKGLNDTEIATALGVARRTVQRYLHASVRVKACRPRPWEGYLSGYPTARKICAAGWPYR